MPRTTLTPTTLPDAYSKVPATLAYTAGDPANNHDVPLTGREFVICRNVGGTDQTITIISSDLNNRTGDSTKLVLANSQVIFQNFPTAGWRQTNGKLNIDVDSANLELAVLKLP